MTTASKTCLLFGYGVALEAVLHSALEAPLHVLGIVASTHRPDLQLDSLRAAMGERHIPIHSNMTMDDIAALLSQLSPDLCVMASFNRIIPPELLQRFNFVNIHYAPLPRYRGWHPINWGLVHGESEFAYTIHQAVPCVDAGPILHQSFYTADENTTANDISNALSAKLRLECGGVLVRYLAGELAPRPQTGPGSKFPKRGHADGKIDFSKSAREIHNLVRAIAPPYPGAHCRIGDQQFRIFQTRLTHMPRHATVAPGTIEREKEKYLVAAQDEWLEIAQHDNTTTLHAGMHLQ